MNRLWKWIMHLNAKAACCVAIFFFVAITTWCTYLYWTPPQPIREGNEKLPELPAPCVIGLLDFVSNQLSAADISIPVDPFRPTMEAIFTNEVQRAAFLRALKSAQQRDRIKPLTEMKEDPFADLRRTDVATSETRMVTPKLSYLGFFKRPDGTSAALFFDSADNSNLFYVPGKQVHGVDILNATIQEATIRFPDGTLRKLPIGASVELAAEPEKVIPKKVLPGQVKQAKVGAGKPGAVKVKPLKPKL